MRSPGGNGLTVLILEQTDATAWQLMPELLRRTYDFCQKYDSDANTAMLLGSIKQAFVLPTPGIVGMLLLMEGKGVVGHLIVTLEEWMGCRMATIVQIESDIPLTHDIVDGPFEFLNDWAVFSGARYFQCLARNDTVARLFQQKYGFERKRILMRKRLEPVVVDDDRQTASTVPESHAVGVGA